MVWAVRAVDPALAPASYYLKSASTYSVGRKDCYITIQTDKTISRMHANLITEEAKAPQTNINNVAHIPRMPLLEFIPFFLCISSSEVRKENPTSRYALRHGAYAVESWKEGCSDVLVDEGSAVTEMVIAAVAFIKPVVQINWWQVISFHSCWVTPEIFNGDSSRNKYSALHYLPTLVFQGVASFTPIKIALPELRRNILQNYSFFLVSLDMYEHGNYLIRILEAAGAAVELLSKTASSIIPTGTRQQLVVKPRDGIVKEGWENLAVLNNIRHLPRTSEDKLVLVVLASYLDVTSLPLPPSPVASADSDETKEESDGNEDQDTAGTLSF